MLFAGSLGVIWLVISPLLVFSLFPLRDAHPSEASPELDAHQPQQQQKTVEQRQSTKFVHKSDDLSQDQLRADDDESMKSSSGKLAGPSILPVNEDASLGSSSSAPSTYRSVIVCDSSKGQFRITLAREESPKATKFLSYMVDMDFWSQVIFLGVF